MTRTDVDALFEQYPWVETIWSIGMDYFFVNPDPLNQLVGVKVWEIV